MKRKTTFVGVVVLALTMALPAAAITDGEPDGNDHPQVGQLLLFVPDAIDPRFNDPGSWFTCSGTLLSETVLLTAGHCTFAVGLDGATTNIESSPLVDTDGDGTPDNGTGGNDVWVNFNEFPDFSILNPSSTYVPDNNAQRYIDWSLALNSSGEWHRGTSNPHPDYNDFAFFLADAGVVELDSAVVLSQYGELPAEGHLDQYKAARRNSTRFTPVGYGLNTGFPTFGGGDSRERANVMLVSLKGTYGVPEGTSVVFSGNKGKAHKGGTCFGDSGGPVFEQGQTLIVAVTSFGITFNCVEPGGYYRIDQEDDLNFIGSFL